MHFWDGRDAKKNDLRSYHNKRDKLNKNNRNF